MAEDIKYVQLEAAKFINDDDFQLMSDSERGIYCTVIFYMYANNGRIKNEPDRIKKLCNSDEGFEEKWLRVKPKFYKTSVWLRHHKVDSVLRAAKIRAQKASEKGLKGAKVKWHKHSLSQENAMAKISKDKIIDINSKEFILSQLLLKLILERKPDFKKPDLQGWAVHIDKMIRIDKRTPEKIEPVIKWCQQDDFWQNNILSTAKLRKQFDQLEMKMKKGNYGSQNRTSDQRRDETYIR